jgi:1,4-alpha-glucan branching enzyme
MEDAWLSSATLRAAAPAVTPDGVVFTIEAPHARHVQLVGDFNGWTLDQHEMMPSGAVWTSVLRLLPGRYQYRYIIDGDWRSDPLNREVEPSPFGGHNSVLVVSEPGPRETPNGV